MNRHDLASSLFWLATSVFVIFKAIELGVGLLSNPGPGFVLFCSSLILGILSLVLAIKSMFVGKGSQRMLFDSWKGLKWHHVLVTVVALFFYAAFLTRIGFLLMTFGIMVLLYSLGKPKPWITVFGAFVTIMLAYIVFHFALQIQFPRGILGW